MKKILLISTILAILFVSSLTLAATYYATVDTYFNVPSTASFNVQFPSDYTGGYNESAANASTTNWISFNFSSGTEEWIEPYTGGQSGDTQSGITQPIFWILNTGNVNETIKVNTSAQTGFVVCANSTCNTTGECQNAVSGCTKIDGEALVTMCDDLNKTKFLNITLYANSSSAPGGESGPATTFIWAEPS